MTAQLALPGLELVPTIAMGRGDSHVQQCAQCGLLAYVPQRRARLGACPSCGSGTWWRQDVPVGPFRAAAPKPTKVQAEVHQADLRPIHLVWRSGDQRSICGERDPLPRCLAWFRGGHTLTARQLGKTRVWCQQCRIVAAHDPTSCRPGYLFFASGAAT